jgi:integrase
VPLAVKRRHGSNNWYIRGSIRGNRVDESTGTNDKRKAEEIRVKREAELLNESIHGRSAVATFAVAALSYMEHGGEKRYVRPLLKHFGTIKLSAIDQQAVDLCAKMLKPGASTATINRQIHTPLSSILKHAAKRKMCSFWPISRPRPTKGKTRWLSRTEAAALLRECAPHLKPLVVFMLYTGARVAEAVYLDWENVDLARGLVMFLDTKNGEDRGVPLHSEVASVLGNLPHRDGAVFRRPDGKPYEVKERDDGGGQIKTAFKGACRRAGIKNATPHTLRHTWATWHYAQNRDPIGLKKLGGWKTESMVTRYTHVNVADLAASISALPSLLLPETGGQSGDPQTEHEKISFRKRT